MKLETIISSTVRTLRERGINLRPEELAGIIATVLVEVFDLPRNSISRAAVAGLVLPGILKEFPESLN